MQEVQIIRSSLHNLWQYINLLMRVETTSMYDLSMVIADNSHPHKGRKLGE